MRQYFTYRLFPVQGGWCTPDRMLQTCFDGLNFTYELEIASSKNDGRRLGWVEVPNSGNTEDDADKINAILESLSAWGVHQKSVEKARDFVAESIKKAPLINVDKLVFPKEVYLYDEIG